MNEIVNEDSTRYCTLTLKPHLLFACFNSDTLVPLSNPSERNMRKKNKHWNKKESINMDP